jgi:hypothetical protein
MTHMDADSRTESSKKNDRFLSDKLRVSSGAGCSANATSRQITSTPLRRTRGVRDEQVKGVGRLLDRRRLDADVLRFRDNRQSTQFNAQIEQATHGAADINNVVPASGRLLLVVCRTSCCSQYKP